VIDFNAARRRRAISNGRVPLDASYVPPPPGKGESVEDFAARIERIKSKLETINKTLGELKDDNKHTSTHD
jgi:hypothetical protein